MTTAAAPVATTTYRLQITNHTLTPRGVYEIGKMQPTMVEARGGTAFVTVSEGTKDQLVKQDDDSTFLVYVLEKDGRPLGRRNTPAPRQTREQREQAARDAHAASGGQTGAAAPQTAAVAPLEPVAQGIRDPAAFLLSKGLPQADIDGLGGDEEIAARAEGLGWTRPAARPDETDEEDEDEGEFDETMFDDHDADALRAYLNGNNVEFHPQLGDTKLRAKALEHARAAAAAPPAEEAV